MQQTTDTTSSHSTRHPSNNSDAPSTSIMGHNGAAGEAEVGNGEPKLKGKATPDTLK
jgi:hypothetical protein